MLGMVDGNGHPYSWSAIYPILGPGFISARNTGSQERNIVHLKHQCGADVVVAAIDDMVGSFGVLQLCGTLGHASASQADFFDSFKAQLEAFVSYLRSGVRPFPFSETEELMRMVIAGIRSREQNGQEIFLKDIL